MHLLEVVDAPYLEAVLTGFLVEVEAKVVGPLAATAREGRPLMPFVDRAEAAGPGGVAAGAQVHAGPETVEASLDGPEPSAEAA